MPDTRQRRGAGTVFTIPYADLVIPPPCSNGIAARNTFYLNTVRYRQHHENQPEHGLIPDLPNWGRNWGQDAESGAKMAVLVLG